MCSDLQVAKHHSKCCACNGVLTAGGKSMNHDSFHAPGAFAVSRDQPNQELGGGRQGRRSCTHRPNNGDVAMACIYMVPCVYWLDACPVTAATS